MYKVAKEMGKHIGEAMLSSFRSKIAHVKTAGSGWDVHGYTLSPEEMNAENKKLEGLEKNPDDDVYLETLEHVESKRVKTPFDRDSSYKMNSFLDCSHGDGSIGNKHSSDFSYGTGARVHYAKKDAKIIKDKYNAMANKYKASKDYRPDEWKYVEGFNKKFDHLMAHPDVKTIRVEWE